MQESVLLGYIEDILDVEKGTLKVDSVLKDFEEWDSLAAISFLALADSQFHKTINSAEIKNAIIVGDLIRLL